jgi:hypothetical protein
MKTIVEISRKAKSIYASMAIKGRQAWFEAMRQSARLIKALKTGSVCFFKTPKSNEEVEVTNRRIAPISNFQYESKGSNKIDNPLLAKVVDLDKFESAINAGFSEIQATAKSIISFYTWSIL